MIPDVGISRIWTEAESVVSEGCLEDNYRSWRKRESEEMAAFELDFLGSEVGFLGTSS